MSYILLNANSMIGDRINRGAEYTSYKILEGVGLLIKREKGDVLIPFTQIKAIFDLKEEEEERVCLKPSTGRKKPQDKPK